MQHTLVKNVEDDDKIVLANGDDVFAERQNMLHVRRVATVRRDLEDLVWFCKGIDGEQK